MLGVMSLWTKPLVVKQSITPHFLKMWALSYTLARKHFSKLVLVTDDLGKKILVDKLNFKFDDVDLLLNQLDTSDYRQWALGKLYAYRAQKQPFIHLDYDVFLFKPIDTKLFKEQLLAQSSEAYSIFNNAQFRYSYDTVAVYKNLKNYPDYFIKNTYGPIVQAANTGLFGGNNLSAIRHYTDLAIKLIEDPDNQDCWDKLFKKNSVTPVIYTEQWLLSTVMKYELDVPITFIHSSTGWSTMASAEGLGYVHLIGPEKHKPENHITVHDMLLKVDASYIPKIKDTIATLQY